MWWLRIGAAVGVVVGLAAWPYAFVAILGLFGDGCYFEGICGDNSEPIFWAAMLGSPVAAVVAGLGVGWATASLVRLATRRHP